MTATDIIFSVVSDLFEKTSDELSTSTDIVVDLGADSLEIVELMLRLEESLNVSIPEEYAKQVRTIGDVLVLIESVESAASQTKPGVQPEEDSVRS